MFTKHYSANVRAMNDDTAHRLRAELVARKGKYRQISRSSGLSYSWLCKFARGRMQNPTMATIGKLRTGLSAVAPGTASPGEGGGNHVDGSAA